MTELQQQPEYTQVLVSISKLLSEYFEANNISNESQAKYSTEREVITGFYPMLKAYATELELFYNLKTEPLEISDRAEAAYWLADELSGRIAENPQLQNVGSLREFDVYNSTKPLQAAFNWGEGLSSAEDRNRFFSWALFLCHITDSCLDTLANQCKKDIYYQIESRDIGRALAFSFSNKQNLDDNIDKLNDILYDGCIYYAENGDVPSREALTKQILSRFSGYENVVSKEQMHQLVYKAALPLRSLIVDTSVELSLIMSNRHYLTRLQQKYYPLILSPEALRFQAFQQKVQQKWSEPMPAEVNNLSANPHHTIPFSPTDNREVQKLELQNSLKLQSEQPEWERYETSHPITKGSELEQGLASLLSNALAANSYYDKGQTSLVYFEFNQLFKVLSITDDRPVDSIVARNLLDFSKELMIYAENSEKYLGFKLADQKLDRKLLAELAYSDELYPDDFKILAPFWTSYANHQKEINRVISNVGFIEPNNQIYRQITELPDSLEKFGATELYYHTNVAIQRLILFKEHECWESSLRNMSKIHQKQFEHFSDTLELIGSAYPEVKKYDARKLAKELERGVCSAYLVPVYSGADGDFEENIFDDIKDINKFNQFSEPAISSVFKAAEDFTEAAIIQHQREVASETAAQVSLSVQQYQTYYDYTEQLITNIGNAAELLQAQSAIYFRYNLHKESVAAQTPTQSYNYELLVHHTPGRN